MREGGRRGGGMERGAHRGRSVNGVINNKTSAGPCIVLIFVCKHNYIAIVKNKEIGYKNVQEKYKYKYN